MVCVVAARTAASWVMSSSQDAFPSSIFRIATTWPSTFASRASRSARVAAVRWAGDAPGGDAEVEALFVTWLPSRFKQVCCRVWACPSPAGGTIARGAVSGSTRPRDAAWLGGPAATPFPFPVPPRTNRRANLDSDIEPELDAARPAHRRAAEERALQQVFPVEQVVDVELRPNAGAVPP